MISNEKAAGADVVAVGQEQRAEQPTPSSRRTQDTHTIAHADHGRRGGKDISKQMDSLR